MVSIGSLSIPLIAALPLVLPVAQPCEVRAVIGDDPCVTVVASNVSRSGGGVSIGGASARSKGSPCPGVSGLSVVTFRDRDGNGTFGSPPDFEVDRFVASSPQAGSSISIGSFTNSSPTNGTATHWEATVATPSGDHSFSGTF